MKGDTQMSIKALLHSEIESQFGELGKMEVGSDIYKGAVEGLTKLIDRSIEMDKMEIESQDKAENLSAEMSIKQQELDADHRDRIIKNWLTGLGIGVPAVLAVWGTLKSMKFEETGTITTIMGRGWLNKLIPKK